MKKRPILFNSEMVRAILEGRKTETRRVIRDQPNYNLKYGQTHKDLEKNILRRCPYGQVGDRLWVRELHYYDVKLTEDRWHVVYDVPEKMTHWSNYKMDKNPKLNKWRPSIHMLRWASRITLEITEIRVEWVQDMNRAAAFLEGCPKEVGGSDGDIAAAHEWFVNLWDSINKKRGFGWSDNPFVWVIKFKRVVQ